MIVVKIITIKSIITDVDGIMFPKKAAGKPTIKQILKILLPITFPMVNLGSLFSCYN